MNKNYSSHGGKHKHHYPEGYGSARHQHRRRQNDGWGALLIALVVAALVILKAW